jgi:hypothetical protein
MTHPNLKRSKIPALLVLTAFLGLAGCAMSPPPAPARGPDPVAVALNAAIAQQNDPLAPGAMPTFTRGADAAAHAPGASLDSSMDISVNYAGEAADLLSRIAKVEGIPFTVEGPVPHLPLFIRVDVTRVSLKDLCRNIGMQFGQRADLVMARNAAGKTTIAIRYRGQS